MVANTQLIGHFPTLDVKQIQPATGEVDGIEVGDTDRGVDHLRRRVHQIFRKRHRAREITHRGAGLARQFQRVTENLLNDFVRAVAGRGVVDILIHHDIIALAQVGDRWLVFRAAGRRNQFHLPGNRVAGGIVFADINILRGTRAADIEIIVIPGDHKTAGRQPGYLGLILTTGGRLIDQEFGTHLGAGRSETLAIDTRAGTVLQVRTPHHHETAIAQCRHAGLVLRIGGEGIDQESIGQHAGGSHPAPIHAIGAAIVA